MNFKPENYGNFFNWTVSYRMDSTVSLPYGKISKTRDHPDGERLEKLIKKFGKNNLDLAKKKNMDQNVNIAWMVSNCLTQSNREGFVEELKKHIPVDVFGPCYQGLRSYSRVLRKRNYLRIH